MIHLTTEPGRLRTHRPTNIRRIGFGNGVGLRSKYPNPVQNIAVGLVIAAIATCFWRGYLGSLATEMPRA
jgi:hypothetical protein